LYAELEGHLPTLPPPDVLEARALLAQLAMEREAAADRLRETLDSDRYQVLMARLVAGAAEPPVPGDDGLADTRARSVVPSLVAKRWRRLRRDVEQFGQDPSNEALHEARKDAKKLRYAGEMARSVVGRRAKGLSDAAEAVQGVLGEVHDAAVAETWLRHQVLVGGGAAGAVAAGEMIEREHERYCANRDLWPKVWKKARKKRLRAWLDKS
jgi:CHAD domain-containing protein